VLPAVVGGVLFMEESCSANSPSPMIEPLLCGIVLGLIPVTLVGLFVAAWNQYRRGSAFGG